MEAAGVPVVPGETPDDQSDDALVAAAARIGCPLLVKPSAGGGGIGMKAVRRARRTCRPRWPRPAAKPTAAFGDGTLYVERLVERPRHVEVQIFGDRHGTLVHLFERECSAQRRHQKVVEETPVPGAHAGAARRHGRRRGRRRRAPPATRTPAPSSSCSTARATTARFYFLEMNTRLQVEHPITECVVGVDLVQAQLAVAAGAPLPWRQDDLAQRGHAIECRVYAEDPAQRLPAAGRPAAPLPRAARARASASTPASSKAARCRSTTIRCSPS